MLRKRTINSYVLFYFYRYVRTNKSIALGPPSPISIEHGKMPHPFHRAVTVAVSSLPCCLVPPWKECSVSLSIVLICLLWDDAEVMNAMLIVVLNPAVSLSCRTTPCHCHVGPHRVFIFSNFLPSLDLFN